MTLSVQNNIIYTLYIEYCLLTILKGEDILKKFVGIFTVTVIILVLMFSAVTVNAYTNTELQLEANKEQPAIGENLKISFILSSKEKFTTVGLILKYDASILKFTSTDFVKYKDNSGVIALNTTVSSREKATFSINFSVKNAGNTKIEFTNIIVGNGSSESTVPDKSISVTAVNNSSVNTGSKSANLKSLSVTAGKLVPDFSPDVVEYSVTVENSITDGIMYCETANAGSKIKIEGERELKVGKTERSVTVTSSSGETKKYTIVFDRLDENGQSVSDVKPTETFIVNGIDMYIADDFTDFTAPIGLTKSTAKVNDTEYPCYIDKSGKYKVFYLYGEDRSVGGFYACDENNVFSEFKYYLTEQSMYVLLNIDGEEHDGFSRSTVEIDGVNADCYRYDNQNFSDFVVVRAISPNGYEGFYRYDTAERTFQRFDGFDALQTVSVDSESKEDIRKYVILSLLALTFVLIIVAVVLSVLIVKRKSEFNETYGDDYSDIEFSDSDVNMVYDDDDK